jgi:multiple antibiotic resistance protein
LAGFDAKNIVVAILINCILVYTLLKDALWLEKILGEGILHVLRKVFGLILLAISVKLFSENAVQLFT